MEKRVLDDIAEIWESRQDSKESDRVILGPNFAEVNFQKPKYSFYIVTQLFFLTVFFIVIIVCSIYWI